MSNHRVRTWDHRGSKSLGPKLLPLGHHLDGCLIIFNDKWCCGRKAWKYCKRCYRRELRRRVDVLNKRGYCCGMKRCGNIVKSCRNNVKDKNHVLNWNETNLFNLYRYITQVVLFKKKTCLWPLNIIFYRKTWSNP
jgi:hypothetical protein